MYSYPIRCSGHRTLSEIPLEIYSAIFAYFKPHNSSASMSRFDPVTRRRIRDLCSLSLVCRLFRLETRRFIFTSIIFRPEVDEQAITRARESRTYHSFLKTLDPIQIPEYLVSQVQRCVFLDWHDFYLSIQCEHAKTFLTKRGEALSLMINLTSVTFYNTLITPQILAALQDVPSLKTLSIEQCEIPRKLKLRKFMPKLRSLVSLRWLTRDSTGQFTVNFRQTQFTCFS
ncbi:hypothetical protein GYMLUDRAFT_45110 [Collybiopsis luxurians FD-317 M1]|uniref:F-box domain-containing protein n=1 Tax=Collybiopsis luxurians FD-317 M1 TaxID=944289 RepID=A0A0D0C8J0_9AGAR|nr:hypothetical protein GYMLUDRAFT_45110 [Collybiopsis luxurians FD-317 M1]